MFNWKKTFAIVFTSVTLTLQTFRAETSWNTAGIVSDGQVVFVSYDQARLSVVIGGHDNKIIAQLKYSL